MLTTRIRQLRLPRRWPIVATTVVVLLAAGTTAWAVWSITSSNASGSAAAVSMPQGNTTTAPSTSTGSVTLTWTAAQLPAGTDIATYNVTRYVGSTGTPISCATQSITGHLVSCTYTETSSGSYQYTNTPTKGLWVGAESAKSGTTVVTVPDTTKPNTPVITFPVNSASYRVATWAALTGTASDNAGGSGVSKTQLQIKGVGTGDANLNKYWNGTAWTTTAAFFDTTGTSNWSYTFATRPADGTYTLQAQTLDVAGNVSSLTTSITFVIDTSAPAVPTGLVLAAGQDTGSSSTDKITMINTPQLTGSAEANSSITLYAGTGTTTPIGTGTTNASGVFTVTVSPALVDGTYTITARATDAAGNQSNASSSLSSLVIDTAAPSAPSSMTYNDRNNSTADQILGTGESGATVTAVGPSPSATTYTDTVRSGGSFTLNVAGINGGSQSVSVTYSVTLTDAAGNVSSAGSITATDSA